MIENVDTVLELEARIFFKKKFDHERYFIEVNGQFYNCTQASVNVCVEIPPDEVPEYSEQQLFSFKTTAEKGVIPAELHSAAERIIQELKLRTSEEKKDFKTQTRGVASGATLEGINTSDTESCLIHKLLKVHKEGINTNLRDSSFKLDADNHRLINDKNHKVVFDTEGGTRSDLYTDLDDENLPENLAQIQIAVVKTLQTLFRETGKTYPKGVTDLFLIQEGFTTEQKQKVATNISPRYKEILRAALLKPEFNDIRHLVTIDHEAIVDNKREAENSVDLTHNEKKQKKDELFMGSGHAVKPKRKVTFASTTQEIQSDESAKRMEKLKDKTSKALFCMDFDNTIASKHTHNKMFENFDLENFNEESTEEEYIKFWDENREACQNFIKGILPIGDSAQWRKLFKTLAEDGHFVAMVSFNVFGKRLIPFYLKEVIGLDDDFIRDHVKIVSFLPPKKDQCDKSKHIAQAKRELNLNDLPADKIVLIDDSEANILGARKAGHRTIQVEKQGIAHINDALELSKSMKTPENKSDLGAQNQSTRFAL